MLIVKKIVIDQKGGCYGGKKREMAHRVDIGPPERRRPQITPNCSLRLGSQTYPISVIFLTRFRTLSRKMCPLAFIFAPNARQSTIRDKSAVARPMLLRRRWSLTTEADKALRPYIAVAPVYLLQRARYRRHGKQDAGRKIRDGIKSVASQGVCPESQWPYDPTPANPSWHFSCRRGGGDTAVAHLLHRRPESMRR